MKTWKPFMGPYRPVFLSRKTDVKSGRIGEGRWRDQGQKEAGTAVELSLEQNLSLMNFFICLWTSFPPLCIWPVSRPFELSTKFILLFLFFQFWGQSSKGISQIHSALKSFLHQHTVLGKIISEKGYFQKGHFKYFQNVYSNRSYFLPFGEIGVCKYLQLFLNKVVWICILDLRGSLVGNSLTSLPSRATRHRWSCTGILEENSSDALGWMFLLHWIVTWLPPNFFLELYFKAYSVIPWRPWDKMFNYLS